MDTAFSGIKRERGLTLIELAIAVAFVSVAGLIWYSIENRAWKQAFYADVGKDIADFSVQARRFVDANENSLGTAVPLPARYTAADLRNAGYPVALGPNILKQSYELWVSKDALGGLKPVVCAVGGRPMPADGVRNAAIAISRAGGKGAYAIDPEVAGDPSADVLQGKGISEDFMAVWGQKPGTGHACDALFVTASVMSPGLGDSALQRDNVPGHPEYNKMNTALDMGGQAVNNATEVNAGSIGTHGLNATSGYPAGWLGGLHSWDVYAEGAIGVGTSGTLMARIGSDGAITGQSITGTDINASGYLRTKGDGGWVSDKWKGGWVMTDADWVRVYGDKNVYTGGQIRAGQLVSDGRAYVGEFLQIQGRGNIGWSCPSDGLHGQASDGSGEIQCVGGVWVSTRGVVDTVQTVSANSCGAAGPTVYAQCPANYKLSGGGYTLTAWRPDGSPGGSGAAPNLSQPSGNAWAVYAGGTTGNSCFVAYAVCLR